jgi:hypothetical protein
MKFVTRCKEGIAKIIAIEDTPHSIALGAAIGILFGITPLFGIKMPLAVALSFILRVNIITTLVIVGLADIFTPALVFVYFAEYKIGCFLFALKAHCASVNLIDEQGVVPQWLGLAKQGLPLLTGSLVVGMLAAIPAYGFVRAILNKKCRK